MAVFNQVLLEKLSQLTLNDPMTSLNAKPQITKTTCVMRLYDRWTCYILNYYIYHFQCLLDISCVFGSWGTWIASPFWRSQSINNIFLNVCKVGEHRDVQLQTFQQLRFVIKTHWKIIPGATWTLSWSLSLNAEQRITYRWTRILYSPRYHKLPNCTLSLLNFSKLSHHLPPQPRIS